MGEGTGASPADERLHRSDGAPLWNESVYLDFVDPARGVAGYVRTGLYPGLGRAWYWACLVGPERPLVIVVDHDVRLPADGSLELRAEGLWADYTVETALDHVTVGLEAFAVSLDDPTDTYRRAHGDRVPFGLDLEWETDGGTYRYPGVDRYEVPCRVHGEVLLANEVIELDGHGQRDHSWGVRDWWTYGWSWTSGRLDDGTRFHGTQVQFDGAQLYGTGYLQPPGGPLTGTGEVARSEVLGAEGLPTDARWCVGGLDLRVEPVAFAPVLLTAGDGRTSRFPRAWCRFTAPDGRTGDGWTEWNQPG